MIFACEDTTHGTMIIDNFKINTNTYEKTMFNFNVHFGHCG